MEALLSTVLMIVGGIMLGLLVITILIGMSLDRDVEKHHSDWREAAKRRR